MAGVLDIESDVPFGGPLGRRSNILRTRRINDIGGILPKLAPLGSRIGVTSDAGAVGEDGRARVIGPLRVADASRILGVERRQVPFG